MLYPQLNAQRNLIQLDGFWKFKKDIDNVGEKEKWQNRQITEREMAVPGSWNEQYLDMYRFMGKGWYQRTLFIPKDWDDQIWMRVGSVFYKAKVWVNEIFLGEHEGGHLPFEFNATNAINKGEENTLTIMVDTTLDPWGLPPAALDNSSEGRVGFFNSNPPVTYDFYPYGGIHRPVYIYTTNKTRIEEIKIETSVKGEEAKINYKVALSQAFRGKLQIECDSEQSEIQINNQQTIEGQFTVKSPKLWGINQPNLYTVNLKIVQEEVLDSYKQTFGIREVKVEGNKLLLNGEKIFLNGFGKHEDFHVIGKGLNHGLIVKDYDLMKWIGANSFRTSHYPYAEEMLDYADRQGILVIAETPFVGLNERMYRPEILEKANKVIHRMIKRDQNHPSIIMWSLANEPNASTPEAEVFFKGMIDTARALDTTRPITYVAHLEPENNVGMKYYDVVCINKYYGWYEGPGLIDDMLPEFEACMDRFYDAFKKPMIIAEFGADAIAGMHSEPALMFSEEFQAEIILKQYDLMKSKPYCIGAHIWNFADFKTAESISRILFNRKGLFTRERQPKLAAHKIKERWTKTDL